MTFGDTGAAVTGSEDLDGLDPVCLMEVEPSTARFTVEYEGRTVGFCAPSCRKLFLADPTAYLGVPTASPSELIAAAGDEAGRE